MSKLLGSLGALGLGVAAAAILPVTAMAQDAPASGEIVVTGSRLSTSANAAQPIVTISSAQLAIRGETQLADALSQLPALLTSNNVEQTVRDGAVTGRSSLDLRGLGTQRTLVLVNGRRHVAGAPGSAAVDISSIPSALVERVDVLTGGASAVYGSDAVTGVVNFILKDDFEGSQIDLQAGSALEGDAPELFGSALFGKNFAGGKGNVTLGLQFENRDGVAYSARDFTNRNNLPVLTSNPALRFQSTDPLPPGVTLAQALGQSIFSGANPRFANTPQALLDRARSASPRAFGTDYRFSISSTAGLFGFAPFGGFSNRNIDNFTAPDLNGNGAADCGESTIGRRGFGCWIVDDTGTVRPYRDGIIADNTNQFGGDGAEQGTDGDSLTPNTKSFVIHLTGKYDFAKQFGVYGEFKGVRNEGREFAFYNTFDDAIQIRLDNPFIPASILTAANAEIAALQLDDPSYDPADFVIAMARDHVDIFDPRIRNTRETLRGVVGAKGDLSDHLSYDFSINYGQTKQVTQDADRVRDRFFAAIDVTTDGSGNPVCRISRTGELPVASDLDPGRGLPVPNVTFDAADCRPLNLFGRNNSSPEALAFQRYIARDDATIEQTVISGVLVGDTEQFFSLPGGPIGVAVGAEYREEKSKFTPDPLRVNGLGFEQRTVAAVRGKYDVKELFAELSLPVLADLPFAETLAFTVAGRASNYSTVGNTTTWKADVVYAPVKDIRFRAGKSETIRAPNISELFLGAQSVNSDPLDVCLQENIGLGPNPAARLANCSAEFGRDLSVTPHDNQRTAQFAGVREGNPNLREEISTSFTAGVVLQPQFLPNFLLTIDYWDIQIEDAVQSVGQDDIVSQCYDAPSLANEFCALFGRDFSLPVSDPGYGLINSIFVRDVNFAALGATGVDFSASYRLDLADIGAGSLGRDVSFGVNGTFLKAVDDFPFIQDPNQADPRLGELTRPELSFTVSTVWSWDKLRFGVFSSYQSEQTLRGVDVERKNEITPNTADATWVQDLSLVYEPNDKFEVTFGLENVLDEKPLFGETSYPVSALGRTGFVRLSLKQ